MTIQHKIKILYLITGILFTKTFAQDPLAQNEQTNGSPQLLNSSQIWGYGFLACFLVSLLGFVAAGVLVCFKKCGSDACFDYFVRFLFSLACGALLGDAFVHILPEAYASQSTNKSIVALVIICSIAFFLILERLFHKFGIAHSHWHAQGDNCDHSDPQISQNHENHQHDQNHNHEHKHNHEHNHKHGHEHKHQHKKTNQKQNNQKQTKMVKIQQKQDEQQLPNIQSNNIIGDVHNHNQKRREKSGPVEIKFKVTPDSENEIGSNKNKVSNEHQSQGHPTADKSSEQDDGVLSQFKGKQAAGYLNLLGSLIHNFVDGLALGIAFATGDSKEFIPVLIAIIAHQIPRQLGDVAILLKSKFSSLQTIFCNGTVNFISLIGGIIGLAIHTLDQATKLYILVFVAGNFIFVAADIWRHILNSKTYLGNILESSGFILGVGAMFLLLLLE